MVVEYLRLITISDLVDILILTYLIYQCINLLQWTNAAKVAKALLLMVARLSGVEGVIELDVAINEEIRAARPIKLEDRVRYLSEKNPLLVELRQALDMEVE